MRSSKNTVIGHKMDMSVNYYIYMSVYRQPNTVNYNTIYKKKLLTYANVPWCLLGKYL